MLAFVLKLFARAFSWQPHISLAVFSHPNPWIWTKCVPSYLKWKKNVWAALMCKKVCAVKAKKGNHSSLPCHIAVQRSVAFWKNNFSSIAESKRRAQNIPFCFWIITLCFKSMKYLLPNIEWMPNIESQAVQEPYILLTSLANIAKTWVYFSVQSKSWPTRLVFRGQGG